MCGKEIEYKNNLDNKLFSALHIIAKNLESPPSFDELENELGVCARQIQYIFSRNMGVSPKQYIKLKQMAAIKSELKSRPYYRGVISDVANKYGIWHMSQFSRDFKSHFGFNPKDTFDR
jgi:AraC family ethanolamine operon transcriptional activator